MEKVHAHARDQMGDGRLDIGQRLQQDVRGVVFMDLPAKRLQIS
jgi:hypothetical protein